MSSKELNAWVDLNTISNFSRLVKDFKFPLRLLQLGFRFFEVCLRLVNTLLNSFKTIPGLIEIVQDSRMLFDYDSLTSSRLLSDSLGRLQNCVDLGSKLVFPPPPLPLLV